MKKLIRKYLKKHLKRENKYYYFYRWFVSISKDKTQTKDMFYAVASWFSKNTDKVNLINNLQDIYVVDNVLYIVTLRPGLWIGKHGSIINSLIDHLKQENPNIEVRLIEDRGELCEFVNTLYVCNNCL